MAGGGDGKLGDPAALLARGGARGPGCIEELPRAAGGGGTEGGRGLLLVLRAEAGKRNRSARARGRE